MYFKKYLFFFIVLFFCWEASEDNCITEAIQKAVNLVDYATQYALER